MDNIEWELTPVENKDSRTYRKGSKYDPLLEYFLQSEHQLVKVPLTHPVFEGKDVNYIRTQLKKRIDAMEHPVEASVVNNELYLERME
jgi:hypothetical protein